MTSMRGFIAVGGHHLFFSDKRKLPINLCRSQAIFATAEKHLLPYISKLRQCARDLDLNIPSRRCSDLSVPTEHVKEVDSVMEF